MYGCPVIWIVNPIVGLSVAAIFNKYADYSACGKSVLNTQKSAGGALTVIVLKY